MAERIQSEPRVYGRSCTVCSHHDLAEIDAGLVAHLPIPRLVQQFDVSRDALYRHLKWHLRPAVQRAITSTPDTRPVAMVERIARIANDARDAGHMAYASGNAALGARLGVAERQALESLADRFGITHDNVAADRAQVAQLARVMDAVLAQVPELRVVVADALEAEGADDFARELRDDIPQSIPEMKVEVSA